MVCLFTFGGVFWLIEVFNSIVVLVQQFIFMISAFGVTLKKSLPFPSSWRYFPTLSSKRLVFYYTHFSLQINIRCGVIHLASYGYLINPVPFAEKTLLNLLLRSANIIKNQVTVYVWVCLGAFTFDLLVSPWNALCNFMIFISSINSLPYSLSYSFITTGLQCVTM